VPARGNRPDEAVAVVDDKLGDRGIVWGTMIAFSDHGPKICHRPVAQRQVFVPVATIWVDRFGG